METRNQSTATSQTEPSTSVGVVIAWLFVGVPLVWGVAQTFLKALDLFK